MHVACIRTIKFDFLLTAISNTDSLHEKRRRTTCEVFCAPVQPALRCVTCSNVVRHAFVVSGEPATCAHNFQKTSRDNFRSDLNFFSNHGIIIFVTAQTGSTSAQLQNIFVAYCDKSARVPGLSPCVPRYLVRLLPVPPWLRVLTHAHPPSRCVVRSTHNQWHP